MLIDRLSTRLPATVASVLALEPIHEPVTPAPAPTAATSPRTQSWMVWAYRTIAARVAQPTVNATNQPEERASHSRLMSPSVA